MDWLSGPLTAIIWIGGIAWILHRYLLGVKFHVNNDSFWIERTPKPPAVKKKPVFLSDEEEIRREAILDGKKSAISPR